MFLMVLFSFKPPRGPEVASFMYNIISTETENISIGDTGILQVNTALCSINER